jgi:hypothetical protein
MSALLDALDLQAKQTYPPGWNNPAIRKYVETGDDAALKSIPQMPQHAWVYSIADALPEPNAWTDECSRLVFFAQTKGVSRINMLWLRRFAKGDWTSFSAAIERLSSAGLSNSEIRSLAIDCDVWDAKERKPTPAGDLVLRGPDAELIDAIQKGAPGLPHTVAHSQPDRLEKLISGGLVFQERYAVFVNIVRANPKQCSEMAYQEYGRTKDRIERVHLICALAEETPAKYTRDACTDVRAYLSNDPIPCDRTGLICVKFMLKSELLDALELCCKWMECAKTNRWCEVTYRESVCDWAKANRPEMVLPMAQACTRSVDPEVIEMGLKVWKQNGVDDPELFRKAISRLHSHADANAVIAGINFARDWDIVRTQDDIWPLMQHKSRPVRGAAARTLASLGYSAAAPNTAKLLAHKKADVRQAAVMLFGQLSGDDALATLKQRLDVEENDDVRDDILLVLERAGSGAALSPEEQQARIAKTLAKSKSSPAEWLAPESLSFKRRDGSSLSSDEVLYLLIRQSRCKEMRADLEAKPVYASLDRAACADSALALVQSFLGSPQDAADRWVLTLAALTGDDRLVPVLRKAILDWAEKSRGKLAEYAVQALALLGTEAALMVVDSLSVRFRSKNKNIGQAAADAFAAASEARGVTVEELGDLVVPWLGFEAGKPRIIETPKGTVEARIDSALKLGFRDLKTGKAMSKLPTGSPAEILAEFKVLAGTLKEAVKAQLLRIETLLVRQFRWPVARWRELYLTHPLLRPFTQNLIWGWRDEAGTLQQTFRALEDATLTDVSDDAVTLGDAGSISLVHPLDISEKARAAWLQHLADYEIAPPFAQLDRPVVRVKPEEVAMKFGKQVFGTEVNAMTFRSRAEKLGWSRGSVCDAGMVTCYRKVFSGAGVDAFLSLDGMYVGISMEESITLQNVCFVKSGSVQVGSYIYDEPSNDNDPRLIPFSEVSPVPFSEVMGDLNKISGKAAEAAPDSE